MDRSHACEIAGVAIRGYLGRGLAGLGCANPGDAIRTVYAYLKSLKQEQDFAEND
jgi:hypothetical protein